MHWKAKTRIVIAADETLIRDFLGLILAEERGIDHSSMPMGTGSLDVRWPVIISAVAKRSRRTVRGLDFHAGVYRRSGDSSAMHQEYLRFSGGRNRGGAAAEHGYTLKAEGVGVHFPLVA